MRLLTKSEMPYPFVILVQGLRHPNENDSLRFSRDSSASPNGDLSPENYISHGGVQACVAWFQNSLL
jgi:hypothetical protein